MILATSTTFHNSAAARIKLSPHGKPVQVPAVDPPEVIEKVSKDLEKKEVIEEESKIEYIIIRNISSRVA